MPRTRSTIEHAERAGDVIVRLDPTSPVPPYAQLRGQVAAMIASGQLAAGHQLPPIRQLATDLALAPGTVARAYRELERSGLVEAGGRRGTRVTPRERWSPASDTDREAALDEAAHAYLATARQLGSDLEQAIAAVRIADAATRATSPP